jgi:hypothetical protein
MNEFSATRSHDTLPSSASIGPQGLPDLFTAFHEAIMYRSCETKVSTGPFATFALTVRNRRYKR